jgi:hypothetical protein
MRRLVRITTAGSIAFAALVIGPGARAGDLVGLRGDDLQYEFAEPYLERIDGVTTSLGNARDINAVTHMIDPWPRHVRNRRIPANGERMARAIDRYRGPTPQITPPPIVPTYTTSAVPSLGALSVSGTGGASPGASGAGGTAFEATVSGR